MSLNSFGSTGGESIGFTECASPAPPVALELKMCELCGKNFTRIRGLGQAYCVPCRDKEAKRQVEIERVMEEMFRERRRIAEIVLGGSSCPKAG